MNTKRRANVRPVDAPGRYAVGVVNLVTGTLVTAIAGARDVGGEVGAAAVTAIRGSIQATGTIGADLGAVARSAVVGTVEAAEAIGGGRPAGHAIEGTAQAARRLGEDAGALMRDATSGALSAAERIGRTAGRAALATVDEVVSGARELAGNPTPRRTARRRRRA
jgi:hypothetical protein